MRSGPKALIYRGALFRISELAWVKVAPLTPLRWGVRLTLGGLGLAFMGAVAAAKGSWVNVEGLLGLLAVHVSWSMHGDVRLASTGDLEDSYEERGGSGDQATFRNWVSALSSTENEVKLGSPDGPYFHWLNLTRIAWARSVMIVETYGLVLAPVFLGYNWLIGKRIQVPSYPVLDEIHLLAYPGGAGLVHFLGLLLALAGVTACATSVRRGVEVRSSGGLSDRLPVTAEDQQRLFEALAGNLAPQPQRREDKPPVAAAPPVTVGSLNE